MATEWRLSSCECIVVIQKDGQGGLELVDWKQKCHIHKDVIDGDLLSTLITHDTQWNALLTGTNHENTLNLLAYKNTEIDRIKALGDIVKPDV